MIKVEFEGGKELEQALFELKSVAAKRIARAALKEAGLKFAEAANAMAPVGDAPTLAQPDDSPKPKRGSTLSKSYAVGTRLSRRQFRLAKKEGRDDVFVYAGTRDPAGMQQEFGNAKHGAQPHARPAWARTKAPMFEAIARDMSEAVAKAVARARKRNRTQK